MLDRQHVLDAAVAVAGGRVDARAVGRGRRLDLGGGDAGDLGRHLGLVLGGAGPCSAPHTGLTFTVLPSFSVISNSPSSAGVDGGVERHGIGQPALRLARQQVVLRGLAALARLLGVVVLALPEAARSRR